MVLKYFFKTLFCISNELSHVKTTTESPQNDLNLPVNNTDIRHVIRGKLHCLAFERKPFLSAK